MAVMDISRFAVDVMTNDAGGVPATSGRVVMTRGADAMPRPISLDRRDVGVGVPRAPPVAKSIAAWPFHAAIA